ncbi:MAG: CRISPR-associated helicase/endonuclease Cas3 [Leptospiraceae bacterium]|nr:MAG: CRISPR-associated helicase/endonuclease Cas3 [Leptospiraceae bacterium]
MQEIKNLNSNLLSHPDRFLENHTSEVIEIALNFLNKKGISDEILKDILTIIVFSHDLGKSTQFFQDYLKKENIKEKSSLKNKPETQHALFGGFIGFYLSERYLKQKNINDPFLLAISFVLPKRHHSNLKNFLFEFDFDEHEIQILKKQIQSINLKNFEIFLNNLEAENKEILKFSLNDINFDELVHKLKKIKKYIRQLKDKKSLDYYINTIFLFSLLLDADKSEVVIKDKSLLFNEIYISPKVVDNYINTFSENSSINNIRKKAYDEITNSNIDLSKKIYTITLPTGIGKTLISFKLALRIAEKVKKEKGIDLKIIYTLPFLSIIEQNHFVIENILKQNKMNPDNTILLKHHHLTGFSYKTNKNEEEFDYDTSRILIEGWNAKIIITTFQQFFYSLIGNKNKMLRKFHKFTNSVVILDEVQSIPYKYWLLLKEVLNQLSKNYNFYVILSTATQPLIFEENQYTELGNKKYFKTFNRYNVFFDKTTKTIEDFYYNLKIDNNKTYLFIMNTVNSAKELYNLLKEDFKDEIIFLSTHIIPRERLNRIKRLKEQKKRIAITTQLVEAGVDIDFDIVYRDLAPFDSLNQSAGRCNREQKKPKGDFYIIKLIDEKNNRHYYSYIYDAILINATEEILTNDKYSEKEFINLVNDYYKQVSKIKSNNTSKELLEMLYSLKFSAEKEKNKINSIEDFILIKEDYYKQDVFIEINQDANKIWEEFSRIWKIQDLFQRKKAFDSIKSEFYQYVISVPIQENPPELKNYFYYVSNSILENYYDLETGYKIKGETFWIF